MILPAKIAKEKIGVFFFLGVCVFSDWPLGCMKRKQKRRMMVQGMYYCFFLVLLAGGMILLLYLTTER